MSNVADTKDIVREEQDVRRLKWVFATTYFVQGTTGLTHVPITYFIKNVLKMSDADGQIFDSLKTIGWLIKPLWGFISDRFPLFGYHRRSWYVFMAFSGVLFWVLNAVLATSGVTIPLIYLVTFNVVFATYAFVDVVGDAIMVENGRRLKRVGSFVTFQWTFLAISNAATAVLGSWFQDFIEAGRVEVWIVFAVAGIFPLMTTIVGYLNIAEERKKKTKTSRTTFSDDVGVFLATVVTFVKNVLLFVVVCVAVLIFSLVLFLLYFIQHPFDAALLALSPFQRMFIRIHRFIGEHVVMVYLFLLFFFWNLNPSVGYIERSYLIDERYFLPLSFGIILGAGGIIFLFSIVLYGRFVRRFRGVLWHHLLYAMVALGVLTMPLSFFLYLDPDHPWWDAVMWAQIPDWLNPLSHWSRYEWFRLIVQTSVLGMIAIPAFLVPLTIAGESVKIAYAGMGYAFLMSLSNATGMLDGLWGGWMYKAFLTDGARPFLEWFHASPLNVAGEMSWAFHPWDRVWRPYILEMFVYISTLCTLFSALFVWLLKRQFDRYGITVNLAGA